MFPSSACETEADYQYEQDEAPAMPGAAVAPPHPGHAAEYIADLTRELATMARNANLDVVAYLLDIVRLESETTATKLNALTQG